MEIQRIMVVGSGLMGSGIAQVAIQAGYDVILNDTTEALAKRGEATLSNNLNRQVKKGKMSEADKAAHMDKVSLSTSLDDAADADFVVEAAFENFEVKMLKSATRLTCQQNWHVYACQKMEVYDGHRRSLGNDQGGI
jgi:3-hydroxybutyryl-CoA dehydrogenase